MHESCKETSLPWTTSVPSISYLTHELGKVRQRDTAVSEVCRQRRLQVLAATGRRLVGIPALRNSILRQAEPALRQFLIQDR
eukprot:6470279-Amphidinium_carterae.2